MSKPPRKELGVVSNDISTITPWSALIDEAEYAPDLRWPASVNVYEKMRADSQIQGLLSGTILPITRFRWSLEDNGADPAITDWLSAELKVPVKGREDQYTAGRMRNRFSWAKHLSDLLRALVYGHYFFEQVGTIEADGLWHLRKLAPRPPRTISEINVAPDGGLVGIKQYATGGGFVSNPGISVDQLLAYTWDREGGNWAGRSMLRSCFRNWLVKDRLIRIDAAKHERNGMGIPWIEAPEGASQGLIDALDEVAQAYRAGDEAGGSAPHGARLRLVGTDGTLPDTIGSVRYHDEQMANAFLMMFISLGSTQTGSRALGEVFSDFFGYAQEGVADWAKDTFNEYMIEDLVDWNWGKDKAAPVLTYERVSDEELATDQLAMLVDKGIVRVDGELESAIRKRYKLPARSSDESEPGPEAPPEPIEASGGRRSVSGSDASPLPDRTLRRQPYPHEVEAATNWKQLDEEWTARRDTLFDAVKADQEAQIEQLAKAVEEASGDIDKLAAIEADPVHTATIEEAMTNAADDGIGQAEAEAKAQGRKGVKRPALDADRIASRARAVDRILTDELAGAARQRAIALSGGSLDAKAVSGMVRDYLLGFKGARVRDQLSGAITQAMNMGRKGFMDAAGARRFYASELLDEATCDACTAIDGTEYATLADAEADYPGGGYSECEGGERCRGTLVAVYDEVEPGPGKAT